MSLAVNCLGMELKTPFLIASGPFKGKGSRIIDMLPGIKDHWGGVVTKTYLRDSRLFMRPYLWVTKELRGVGMQNAGSNLTEPTKEEMRGLAESCRAAHDVGLAIIASIMGRNPGEWGELADMVQEAGCDAIELNLSCPAKATTIEEGLGYIIGQNPELAAEATQAVKGASAVPVIPKLTPNVSDMVAIARACQEAGADGLAAINTVQGIIGIDVETTIPFSSDLKGRAYVSGLSGPMVRPIGLKFVSDICTHLELPVIGIGGVEDWKSAVEYIMLGATAVQVCTAFMWKGQGMGRRMARGLSDFMARHDYQSIEDFRGKSLAHLTTDSEKMEVTAVIDEEKCNGCGVCVTACGESQYDAVHLVDKLAVIDKAKCQGCGLCFVVCKQEAVSFK